MSPNAVEIYISTKFIKNAIAQNHARVTIDPGWRNVLDAVFPFFLSGGRKNAARHFIDIALLRRTIAQCQFDFCRKLFAAKHGATVHSVCVGLWVVSNMSKYALTKWQRFRWLNYRPILMTKLVSNTFDTISRRPKVFRFDGHIPMEIELRALTDHNQYTIFFINSSNYRRLIALQFNINPN